MIINTLEDAIKTIENDPYLDEVMTAYTPSDREVEFNVRPLFVDRLWVKLDPSRRAMTVEWLIEDSYHEIDHEFAADELIGGELFFECVNAIWRNKRLFRTEEGAIGTAIYLPSNRKLPLLEVELDEHDEILWGCLRFSWPSGRRDEEGFLLVERGYSDPYSAPVFRLEIVSKDMAPGKSSFELPLPCDGQLFVDTLKKRLEPLDATVVLKKLRPITRKALDEYLAVIEQNI